MNPAIYVALISAILNIFIGGYILSANPKKNTNKVFTVLVLFFALFCFSEFLVRLSSIKEMALFFGQIGYSVLPIGSCLSINFSLVFPRTYPSYTNIFARHKYLLLLLYIAGIVIYILFLLFTSVNDVQMTEWGYRVVLNHSTQFILVWFLFGIGYALATFLHTYYKKNITVNEKKQVRLVTLGLFIIPIFSLATNLVPPLFNISMFPMTSIAVTIFSIIVAYSMVKYKLMALTPAETADIVMNTMADSLIVANEIGTIVHINKSALNLLKYQEKELKGSTLNNIIKISAPDIKEGDRNSFQSVNHLFADDKLENIECQFLTKDGNTISMNISTSVIYGNERQREGIVIVARDLTETKQLISDLQEAKTKLEEKVNERTIELLNANKELHIKIEERKKAEEQIKISLKEKELLLKEIHHRVKNNLQVITSLLDLQAGNITDKQTLDLFKESKNRIKSMSLAHEQLYQSKNFSKVDFNKYVQALAGYLFHSYGVNTNNIILKMEIKDSMLNIDQAILCSLIINELVSNVLKHAFPGGKNGEISINFKKNKNEMFTLIVSDNGVGFPKEIDFRQTKSLGLQLVYMLTQQLKGTIELVRDHGTLFKINFPDIKIKGV